MNFEKKIFKFYKYLRFKNIDTSLSTFCHFSCSEAVFGHHFFKKKFLSQKNNTSLILNYLKHLFGVAKLNNIEIIQDSSKKEFKKIFVSWARYKDFDKNGDYNDRYTNVKSKNYKNFCFFLIYSDEKLPKQISKNIVILKMENKTNYLLSIPSLLKILIKYNFNIINFLHYGTFSSQFAIFFHKKFSEIFNLSNINKIFMPYEGQQFQNYLIEQMRKNNFNTLSVGYLSHTHPYPIDLIKREGAPDKVFIHSKVQQGYLIKNLGWSKRETQLISSPRLKKIRRENFHGKVFLPYKINNSQLFVKEFSNFIKTSDNCSLPYLKLITHPHPYNLSEQKNLRNSLKKIIKNNKIKFKSNCKNKFSIIIGISTTIFYALEHGTKVLHFHNGHFLQKLSNNLWKNLKINNISNYVSEYKINTFGNYIKMSNKLNNRIL